MGRISPCEVPEAMTAGESCAVHCVHQEGSSVGTFLLGHILSKAEEPF